MNLLANSTFHRIVLVAIIAVLLWLWNSDRIAKAEEELRRKVAEQNYNALRDSSETYIDSLDGLLTSERLAFIGDKDSLEKYNASLARKVSDLESREGTVILTGSTTDISVKGFSGEATNTELQTLTDTTYKFKWFFEDSGNGWAKALGGHTNFGIKILENELDIIAGNTVIDIDSLNFVVDTYFQMNPDSSYSALAKSSYPGMILRTSGVIYPEKIVESIPIIPPKHRISWGIQSGVGMNPLQVGSANGAPIMFYVGVGIQYELGTIFKW